MASHAEANPNPSTYLKPENFYVNQEIQVSRYSKHLVTNLTFSLCAITRFTGHKKTELRSLLFLNMARLNVLSITNYAEAMRRLRAAFADSFL